MRIATNTWCALGLTILTGSIGCQQQETPAVSAPEPPRPVRMHKVENTDHDLPREYPGTIEALRTAEIAFEVSGKLEQLLVVEGDSVKAGCTSSRNSTSEILWHRWKRRRSITSKRQPTSLAVNNCSKIRRHPEQSWNSMNKSPQLRRLIWPWPPKHRKTLCCDRRFRVESPAS